MQFQTKLSNDNTLPYQPIKFVYTQTIGSVLQKFKEIIDPYTWTYQDILQPKILTNPSKVEYYLFHIAPIYNWLRKVQSNILTNYLILGQKGGNPLSLNKPTFSTQKGSEYKKFDQKSFLTQIKHYLQQWQIVKLCTSAKVKIITTKTDELMQHVNQKLTKNQNPNIKNQSQTKKQPQMRCMHMIKKQKFTSEYTLNDFTPSNIRLQCTKVFCEDCQEIVKVKAQITKYPFAPYFLKYYRKEFILNQNISSKLTYQLTLVYGQEKTYIKTSGGVWYEVSREKTSIVSFDKIQLKSGLLFVYQQSVQSSKVLRKAQPIVIKENPSQKLQQISFNTNQDSDSQNQLQQNQPKFEKPKDLKFKDLNKNNHNLQGNNQKSQKIEEEPKDDEVLQDMSKNPLPVILNKKTTDRKLFKSYKKTVEGLLPKQKMKDEYERNYDKGKTKKIHKNRQIFRTADFFKLYVDKKGNNTTQPSSNNDRQEVQRFQEKQKSSKTTGPYRQKDEQYNQVYQDKRASRRSRGSSENKFGNKFNRDRPSHGRGGHGFASRGQDKKFNRGGYKGKNNRE